MGKSAAVGVLEHFNSCVESIEKNKILQVFSDEPNVNLSFLKILDEHRRDAKLNPLIYIETCGLHTVYNSFKYGKKDGNWNIKKLLNLMKVHHAVQVMKVSLLHQNVILHFVSILTDGLGMMLFPERLFQFGRKCLKFLFLERTA